MSCLKLLLLQLISLIVRSIRHCLFLVFVAVAVRFQLRFISRLSCEWKPIFIFEEIKLPSISNFNLNCFLKSFCLANITFQVLELMDNFSLIDFVHQFRDSFVFTAFISVSFAKFQLTAQHHQKGLNSGITNYIILLCQTALRLFSFPSIHSILFSIEKVHYQHLEDMTLK